MPAACRGEFHVGSLRTAAPRPHPRCPPLAGGSFTLAPYAPLPESCKVQGAPAAGEIQERTHERLGWWNSEW